MCYNIQTEGNYSIFSTESERTMVILKNQNMTVTIAERGAEMQSIRINGNELLWQGIPEIWSGRAPILFPICGGLKNNKFTYEGKEYTLNKHGYARNTTFSVESATEKEATFLHVSDEETKKCYPFTYEFRVTYALIDNGIKITFKIDNLGEKPMYFSIGSHEAYLTPGGIEDYDLIFPQKETLGSYQLLGNYLTDTALPIIKNSTTLPLYDKFFMIDAIVFKDIKSESVTLRNRKTGKYVRVEFPGKPYFAVWHKHGAPYICLEPWAGIPDSPEACGDITKKEGINSIGIGGTYEVSHTVTFGEE